MNDPVWYYARGDTEHGPLSTAQIKALASAGKIRADDLVWKEGMAHWAPASEVGELLPSESRAATQQKNTAPPTVAANSLDLRGGRRRPRSLGHTSLAIGMLVVLFARSCDSLGEHHVERLQAELESAENELDDRQRRERRNLESEIESLQVIANRSPSQQQQLAKLTQQLAQINEKHQSERAALERDVLQELRASSRAADARQRIWGFWQQAAFLLGTMVLTLGLLAVSFTSDGPEKWICLTLLAAIVASVYLAGGW